MKKIVSIIACVCLCFVPLLLSGCETDKTPEDIFAKYNEIKNDTTLSVYFSANHTLSVTYSSTDVNNAAHEVTNPLRIVFDIYEPVLTTCTQMSFTKLDDSEPQVKIILDRFDKNIKNELYKKVENLGNVLRDFDVIKNRFDEVDGSILNRFIREYERLIDAANDFNLYFADNYYNEFMDKDYINSELSALSGSAKDFLLYGKAISADLVYRYQVKNITHEVPSQSIVKWEQGLENFQSFVEFAKDNSSGAVITSYDRILMQSLKDGHETFLAQREIFNKAILQVDVKDFYYSTISMGIGRETYLDNIPMQDRVTFRAIRMTYSNSFAEVMEKTKALR